jgi:integrase
VAHGFRALASTTLNEQEFNPDVIEAALAHVDKNAIRKAYNRSKYLKPRAELMAWWSDHIENSSKGSLGIASAF